MLKHVPVREANFLALILILFQSCSTYQFHTFSTVGSGKFNGREWAAENDSVEVTYSFDNYYTPLRVRVYNKLSEPIQVDWKKSAIVVNSEAISFLENQVSIDGTLSGSTYRLNKNNETLDGKIAAKGTLPEQNAFIPPHSQVEKDLPWIPELIPASIPDSVFKDEFFTSQGKGLASKRKVARFTPYNTPLTFRSYITLVADNSAPKPHGIEQQFYISEIVRTSEGPKTFRNTDKDNSPFFYTRRNTAVAAVVSIGLAALFFGVVSTTSNSIDKTSFPKP